MLDCGENTYRSISDKGLVSRRLLRVPWTGRSNQSILKEINPEYSLEGLMLKLKLQYFGHLMWKDDSLGKDPDAGKDWGQEEKGVTEDEMAGWHHQLNGHELEQTSGCLLLSPFLLSPFLPPFLPVFLSISFSPPCLPLLFPLFLLKDSV